MAPVSQELSFALQGGGGGAAAGLGATATGGPRPRAPIQVSRAQQQQQQAGGGAAEAAGPVRQGLPPDMRVRPAGFGDGSDEAGAPGEPEGSVQFLLNRLPGGWGGRCCPFCAAPLRRSLACRCSCSLWPMAPAASTADGLLTASIPTRRSQPQPRPGPAMHHPVLVTSRLTVLCSPTHLHRTLRSRADPGGRPTPDRATSADRGSSSHGRRPVLRGPPGCTHAPCRRRAVERGRPAVRPRPQPPARRDRQHDREEAAAREAGRAGRPQPDVAAPGAADCAGGAAQRAPGAQKRHPRAVDGAAAAACTR